MYLRIDGLGVWVPVAKCWQQGFQCLQEVLWKSPTEAVGVTAAASPAVVLCVFCELLYAVTACWVFCSWRLHGASCPGPLPVLTHGWPSAPTTRGYALFTPTGTLLQRYLQRDSATQGPRSAEPQIRDFEYAHKRFRGSLGT